MRNRETPLHLLGGRLKDPRVIKVSTPLDLVFEDTIVILYFHFAHKKAYLSTLFVQLSTMSSITITPERVAQVQATVRKFVTDFSKPQSSDEDVQSFLSVYRPDIQWSDHAFLVTRVGHEAVLGLYRAWNHCNQPFRTEIKVQINLVPRSGIFLR